MIHSNEAPVQPRSSAAELLTFTCLIVVSKSCLWLRPRELNEEREPSSLSFAAPCQT